MELCIGITNNILERIGLLCPQPQDTGIKELKMILQTNIYSFSCFVY